MRVRRVDDRLHCRLVDVAEAGGANDEDAVGAGVADDVADRQRRQLVADRTQALGVSGIDPVEEAKDRFWVAVGYAAGPDGGSGAP
jgi:hypothetical protein